ncbi:MAG: long-chain fatty acid--CoA ligase [Ectothiorhodospiraceae bacterium]|nr:long-chain fatty acid--CoA ligase [Ectothiorhodospiraceae bacterium]MCH8505667.1 long-chain fatty acid--CoA ligase [Ectothiorhodospiraceae bacterium]
MYLTQGLHRAAQKHPDKTATVCAQGEEQTFLQLERRVSRLAGALRGLGVQPGDRVAMLGRNSARYLEYFQAVWWAGAVANPVNTRWSVAEIVFSLDDCATTVLIVDDAFVSIAPDIHARAATVTTMIYAGNQPQAPDGMLHWETLIETGPALPDERFSGDTLAAILYTGGTTGLPKGVMLSHTNFLSASLARAAEFPCPPDTVALLVPPVFHVAGLGRLITQTVVGGTTVMQPVFDPEDILRKIEQYGVNELLLIPSMIQMLVDHPAVQRYRVDSIERLGYGASPISDAVLERAQKVFPKAKFMHAYGMTETAAVVSMNPPENHSPEARASGRIRSIGRPGYGSEIRIVDPDGNEVPRNTVGEIIVRGANVTSGYWNRPEETARALRDGWMYTGDGAYMDDDGYIYVTDRIKDMIITGGENVYSIEVESVLARHPAVASCAVIGIPHETWGEAVHAVVVPREGSTPDEDELRNFCREFLAGYKCPKTVEFRGELPMSGAGKILKRELRKAYQ